MKLPENQDQLFEPIKYCDVFVTDGNHRIQALKELGFYTVQVSDLQQSIRHASMIGWGKDRTIEQLLGKE